MRTVIIILATLIGTSIGQNYRASQDAAILSDARYLDGDGAFGAAYSQEDGVQFKEESDANGDRKGSYSYVDPSGHRRTVFYTAGKNGFQATGDHIPTARPVVAPQPEYEPLPQYNPPDYRPPPRQYQAEAKPRSHYAQESIYQPQPEPRYYPRPQYHRPPPPAPSPPPPAPQLPVFRPEPQYRPQYRPPRPSDFQPQPDYNQPQAQFQYQPRPQYEPQPAPRPPGPYSPVRPQYNEITTPVPRRFHPPGKLDFNRTPEGFSYTFSKA